VELQILGEERNGNVGNFVEDEEDHLADDDIPVNNIGLDDDIADNDNDDDIDNTASEYEDADYDDNNNEVIFINSF